MRALKRDGGVIKRNGSGKLGCCCDSCLSIWGEVITLTLSGVASCGCIDFGDGFAGFTGSVPSEWTLTYNVISGQWEADPAGSATYRTGLEGCDEDNDPGHFDCVGICDAELGMGIILGWVSDSSSVITQRVYEAVFPAPGGAGQANLITCDLGYYFGDGTGSLT